MTKKRKIVTTIILGSLLAVLYCIIFLFSSQNGETSGGLSQKILKGIISFIKSLFRDGLSNQNIEGLSNGGEVILRKAAHFSEYACMGILTFEILICYIKKGKAYLLSLVWVFLSAAFDEWHQTFVPGRCGSFPDVLLDTIGGATGALLCFLIILIIDRKRKITYHK